MELLTTNETILIVILAVGLLFPFVLLMREVMKAPGQG